MCTLLWVGLSLMAQKEVPFLIYSFILSAHMCVYSVMYLWCLVLCNYVLFLFFVFCFFWNVLPRSVTQANWFCVCVYSHSGCSLLLPKLSWHFPRHWVISCSITVGLNQMPSPPLGSSPSPWLLPALPCLGPTGNGMAAIDSPPAPDSLDSFFS